MSRQAAAVCAIALAFAAESAAQPRLRGGDGLDECEHALQIATATFRSPTFHMYEQLIIPSSLSSSLIGRAQEGDISGGDALDVDDTVFTKLPRGDAQEVGLYWQRRAQHGYRLVIQEVSWGWRGDRYSLFTIDESVTPEQFLADVRDGARTKLKEVLEESLRPPFLLQARESGRLWAIEAGDWYSVHEDWQVYLAQPTGLEAACTVHFTPPGRSATDALPSAVRHLAALLVRTLGSGKYDGTLQQTERLRIRAGQTWANVAQRPWALSEAYNTRADVDAGLQRWSEQGPAYRDEYRAIKQQYVRAQRALARYYAVTFDKPPAEAEKLAAYSLDIAFRSNFVFPGEDVPPRPNPWRDR